MTIYMKQKINDNQCNLNMTKNNLSFQQMMPNALYKLDRLGYNYYIMIKKIKWEDLAVIRTLSNGCRHQVMLLLYGEQCAFAEYIIEP